ncbi:MAG: hypothetical protein AB7K52_07055 [Phycisphaerales bacterium]
MSDRTLDRYTGRLRESADKPWYAADLTDWEAVDEHCFGWLRGINTKAVCLELRLKDGSIVAIPYAYIERLEFDPSTGITLIASGRTIRITGRNLNSDCGRGMRLFEGIARARVPWIKEDSRCMSGQDNAHAIVIDGIEW